MKCKNCFKDFDSNFCPNCGQEHIERLNFSQVIDVLIGSMYHFHWGTKFFKTIFFLLIKPKNVVVEYIDGRRKSHYNPGSLFVIFSTFYFFTTMKIGGKEIAFLHNDFYTLLAIFSSLIITALLTYIFFKNYHFNMAEHLIISMFYNSIYFLILGIYNLFVLVFNFQKIGIYGLAIGLILTFYFFFNIFSEKKIISGIKLLLMVPLARTIPILIPFIISKIINLIQ